MCGRAKLSTDFSEIKIAFRVPPEYPTPNTSAGLKSALRRNPATASRQMSSDDAHTPPRQ